MKHLTLVIILLISGCSTDEPRRPEGIPENAKYVQSGKRGYWMELVEARPDYTLRYRIYNYDQLIFDNEFQIDADCLKEFSSPQEMADNIMGYYFSYIEVKSGLFSTCKLELVKNFSLPPERE